MSKRNSKYNPIAFTQAKTALHPRLLTNGYVSIKQCRHGFFMYNLNDLCVGRLLDIYGEWSEMELDCLGQILKNGDVVVDVGANIGTHTVFFSKKVGTEGMVYAFEPQKVTFEFLCANLALNGMLNVLPMQAGAGDLLGEVIVPVLDPTVIQNFAALNIEGHSTGNPVKILPLDSLELNRCNLIKIDVEGMELKVLRGAEKTIQTCRPFIFVENHHKDGSPEMTQMLFDWGYNCWWHIAHYYNPENFFQNKKEIWQDVAPEANMFCVPREVSLNVTGFEPVINFADTWMQALTRMGLVEK